MVDALRIGADMLASGALRDLRKILANKPGKRKRIPEMASPE
jgi:hypothetical protein